MVAEAGSQPVKKVSAPPCTPYLLPSLSAVSSQLRIPWQPAAMDGNRADWELHHWFFQSRSAPGLCSARKQGYSCTHRPLPVRRCHNLCRQRSQVYLNQAQRRVLPAAHCGHGAAAQPVVALTLGTRAAVPLLLLSA